MIIMATVSEKAATVPVITGVATPGACARRQLAMSITASLVFRDINRRDRPPQVWASSHGSAASPAKRMAAMAA